PNRAGIPNNVTTSKNNSASPRRAKGIAEMLKPHVFPLSMALLAAVGEGVANLLEPWPLKIVIDNVLKCRQINGWATRLLERTVGSNTHAILEFAVVAVVGIAVIDAGCSYAEKYLTTSVGQWVMHDLRSTVYSHIQRLSLSFHDQKRTGD